MRAVDPWRREVERLERLSDWLVVALCVGIPLALVIGAVLGHFTWGAS